MTWSYTTNKNTATATAAASLNVSLNSTLFGSFIAVGTACWDFPNPAPTSVAVSDGTNGSYTSSGYSTTSDSGAGLSWFSVGAGGNLTITTNPTGGVGDSQDIWVVAAEFAGNAASPATGTPATANGTSTTPLSGTTTPAVADALMLAFLNTDSGGTITENRLGEGYSLIAEREGASDANGSFVYKILSGGSGVGQSESWTLGANEVWSTVIAAFAPDILMPQAIWVHF